MTDNVVHVIDDDAALRDGLKNLLEAAGYAVRLYVTAEEFLAAETEGAGGCVLIDVRLPGMSGRELHRMINTMRLPFSVIIMTGHGDIPMAVAAVKEGAIDFVEKPFDPGTLLDSVHAAVDESRRLTLEHAELARMIARFHALTRREQEVMRLLISGSPTKTIAAQLGISPRTAETHRARVMDKMEARTLSNLVRQGLALEKLVDWPQPA
jgi:two-component system response regulator FixJ